MELNNWGCAMTQFQVGSVTITNDGLQSNFIDRPERGLDETTGSAQLVSLETPDGFIGMLGIITWPEGQVDVRLVDFAQGGPAYERQKTAGTLTIKPVDDTWVVRISALKINGKEWPTLNRVSWADLDWLSGGDAQAILKEHGATKLGLFGDLAPNVGKRYQADLGMTVPAGNVDAIAALYAITRTMAIMKNFGASAGAGVVQ